MILSIAQQVHVNCDNGSAHAIFQGLPVVFILKFEQEASCLPP